ncbi:ALK and LTK ligand 1 [Trichechus manatus latirostris]|uniref:ALK and LTK ligand 1 n=1 Tax=Trichechus manatus latirostris TaxID=127582 RepID=A0A2Y9E5M9_TRIMA|nr:ALK and LTK ligand 1 [Trichechus manatus latirostris]
MPPARGRPLLPVLLLLALALSLPGAHAARRGRSVASAADKEPKPSPIRSTTADTARVGLGLLLRPQARATLALRAVRSAEIFPRNLNLKDKFIKHFTGPVTFSAECSKHFHRLYYNTRDCSMPTYYKRCARLLTRLAVSPLCTQT